MYTYTNSKERTYILHRQVTTLKNGTRRPIHYFAREAKEGQDIEQLDAVPEGYQVVEQKNGLPILKKAAA